MAALAILLHAIPNFVDVQWRGETFARWLLVAYGISVAVLLYGFLVNTRALGPAGDLLLCAIGLYIATALATLAGAMKGERIQRAVARAFAGTLMFLFASAIMGYGLASFLAGRGFFWAAALASAHAALGTLGWLSLLIFGVSMRTFRPITGEATRFRWMHIVVGSLAVIGVPMLAAGLASANMVLAWIGGAMFAVAAAGYAFDAVDILRRATVTHRPPQAFIAASIMWFLLALIMGGGVLGGKDWQGAYMFVLLMGWIGQMVIAHFHHIGVRLIATMYRGEDDETPPDALLQSRLSWFTFGAFQIAIALCVVGLLEHKLSLVARGSVFGFAAWIAMTANMFAARLSAAATVRQSA